MVSAPFCISYISQSLLKNRGSSKIGAICSGFSSFLSRSTIEIDLWKLQKFILKSSKSCGNLESLYIMMHDDDDRRRRWRTVTTIIDHHLPLLLSAAPPPLPPPNTTTTTTTILDDGDGDGEWEVSRGRAYIWRDRGRAYIWRIPPRAYKMRKMPTLSPGPRPSPGLTFRLGLIKCETR